MGTSRLFKAVGAGAALLSVSFMAPVEAQASNRIGLGLGSSFSRGGGGLALQYDHAPVFSSSWSLGGELFLGQYGALAGAMRAQFWEHGTKMAGFHIGPKLWIAIGEKGSGFGVGGEGGWSYRFAPGFDLGLSLNLMVGGRGIGHDVRINLGYLF